MGDLLLVTPEYLFDDIIGLLAGDPPASLEGTFDGMTSSVHPEQPELDSSFTYGGTMSGTRRTTCPDESDPDVWSQEERGDPCR